MGDRGNVFFVDGATGNRLVGIYMYTHWAGSALPAIVRAALVRGRGRWGDSQYLARIVFCELIKDAVLDETGYGLGTAIGDNEHAIIRIDDRGTGRVSFHRPGTEQRATDRGFAAWSYDEYLAAPRRELDARFAPVEEAPVPARLPRATARAKKPSRKQHSAKRPPSSTRRASRSKPRATSKRR